MIHKELIVLNVQFIYIYDRNKNCMEIFTIPYLQTVTHGGNILQHLKVHDLWFLIHYNSMAIL